MRETDDEASIRSAQRAMVQSLARRGVRDARVLDAMGRVPRERFVPRRFRLDAYHDGPLPIGGGQTISQPLVVALMAQAAEVGPDDVVLEVGAGSGYASAVLGLLARKVIAVERDPALALSATRRLSAFGGTNVDVICGDGSLGSPESAPFDAIVVSAAPSVAPPALKRQLSVGGRLIVPVGDQGAAQRLMRVTRMGDADFREESLCSVRFVPLVEG